VYEIDAELKTNEMPADIKWHTTLSQIFFCLIARYKYPY